MSWIGKSIAHYSISEKIGAGGMGEVYRASDPKLRRDVALKILPDLFANDASRMARFEREAHVLASLNHPNIASIYGLEEQDGVRCLVLELIAGETLAEKIAAAPVPVDEALEISRQIVDALEAAHDKGVIHRDLKPANVKITPEGTVKVLDFGLAKALEDETAPMGDMSHSPTLTSAATRAGVIMGTAAYMSPEQAKGKPVDRRTDVWSFGVVLFEMLAGSSAFGGETVSDTLASVLKVDPDWGLLPASTPAPVRDLLQRCLERDVRQRLQSIGEARIAIQAILKAPSPGREASEGAPAAEAGRGPRAAVWVALLVLASAAAGLAGWWMRGTAPTPPARAFSIEPASLDIEYGRGPALSPDGRRLAFIASGKVWIRDVDSLQPREMPGIEGARALFWSPDGAELAFGAGGKLYKVPATGGTPSVVGELFKERLDAGAWSGDGSLYLAPSRGPMYKVAAMGGDPKPYLEPVNDQESDFHEPYVLPGGKGLLYVVHRKEGSDTIEAYDGSQRRVVLRVEGSRLYRPLYDPRGYIVYARAQKNPGIWAAPFSMSSLSLAGEPFLVFPNGVQPSLGSDGSLVYAEGEAGDDRNLVWVDRTGKMTGVIGEPLSRMYFPEVSEDGTKILVSGSQIDNYDIWVYDPERNTRTRTTFDPDVDWSGAWYAGDERIAYNEGIGSVSRILARAADGTDEPVEIVDNGRFPSFRPGVPYFAFSRTSSDTGSDLYYQPLEGGGEPKPFLVAEGQQGMSQLSPDGTYLAYGSDESGRFEIYLKEFPSAAGKWQVSVNGGIWPRWSREGGEIFFVERGDGDQDWKLMSVKVATKPSLRLGAPEVVFSSKDTQRLLMGPTWRYYDVTPGGQRFVVVQAEEDENQVPARIVFVESWFTAHTAGAP